MMFIINFVHDLRYQIAVNLQYFDRFKFEHFKLSIFNYNAYVYYVR